MKIAHIAPFGPNKSGLYEAARDFMRADYLSGHEVFLIDKGFSRPTGQEYAPIDSVDDRGGFKVFITNPSVLSSVDIIIDHAGMNTEWLNMSTAPIINIVHGRPVDSFGMEYWNNNKSYTYEAESAKMDRVKKVVYFWPEFKPFWDSVFPEGKSVVLDYPTMDENRFSMDGDFTPIEDKHRGDFNILICDSWGRKDIDMFEIINGVIQAGREMKNFKLHFYSVDTPIKGCWDLLYKEMYKLKCMGELCARMPNMERIYRKMDCVLTPHRIITRVVGEALLTGKPIIASNGCKVAQFHCDPHDPHSVAKAIREYINSDKEAVKRDVMEQAKKLHLYNYSREMNKIYEEIVDKKKVNNTITKKETPIKLYQIYYKEEQLTQLEKGVIPYNNIPKNNTPYNGEGEFFIFLQEYLNGNVKDENITGYLSWVFKQKTQISCENFKNFIKNNPGNDLYFINPFPHIMNAHHNTWTQADLYHPGIIILVKDIFSKLGYNPELITSQRHGPDNSMYCNYWAGNKNFWDRYMAWCQPIYNYVKNNEDIEFKNKMLNITTMTGSHCYFGYMLERLINVFINLEENSDFKIINFKK